MSLEFQNLLDEEFYIVKYDMLNTIFSDIGSCSPVHVYCAGSEEAHFIDTADSVAV
jgi:hypothetical protein